MARLFIVELSSGHVLVILIARQATTTGTYLISYTTAYRATILFAIGILIGSLISMIQGWLVCSNFSGVGYDVCF